MTLMSLAAALVALLATPGPTNTLMALAGAELGWRKALRLIPAELAAYLAVALPLALAGADLLAAVPPARQIVATLAALWVMWLAVRMWHLPKPGEVGESVTFRKVFLTTLLNPKALVVGLVLLPGDGALAPRAALFAVLIVVCAMAWVRLGLRAAGTAGLSPLIRRGAACWLALLSVGLAAGALPG